MYYISNRIIISMSSKGTAKAIAIDVEEQKAYAERVNGWAAMLGIVAALGAYATTGQIIPGIF